MSDESVVIDVLTVTDDHQQEVIDKAHGMFDQMSLHEGFVRAEIHLSADGTAVLCYSRMQTEADRQKAGSSPEMLAAWQDLQAIVTSRRMAFDLVRVFYPRKESGGVDFQGGT